MIIQDLFLFILFYVSREVAAAAAQLSHARDASAVRCLSGHSGPAFFYLSRFSNTHILIFELVIFLMSKIHQILHEYSWEH
jgi:hypothetical protein